MAALKFINPKQPTSKKPGALCQSRGLYALRTVVMSTPQRSSRT